MKLPRHRASARRAGELEDLASRSSWSTPWCLLSFVTGVDWTAAAIFLVLYWGRMFFITAGYHRYFSHRSLQDRPGACSSSWPSAAAPSAQKGALWWASHHRNHHRYSRHRARPALAAQKGFWWSHVGWILCDKNNDWDRRRHQGLRQVPRAALPQQARLDPAVDRSASRCYLIGGWSGLVVRVLLVDRAAVARHVHRELARPRDGPPPLRHHRHQPELRPHRPPHPAARAGTTTTTTTRPRPARASSGGSSTSATTCSRS